MKEIYIVETGEVDGFSCLEFATFDYNMALDIIKTSFLSDKHKMVGVDHWQTEDEFIVINKVGFVE